MIPTIALIAHDTKKGAMAAFAKKYAALLSRYRLIATGMTGQRVQEETGLAVEQMLSGAMGGDVQIAAEVVSGNVIAVLFLIDQASDIHLRRDHLNGPVPRLQLYDTKTATFVRPED